MIMGVSGESASRALNVVRDVQTAQAHGHLLQQAGHAVVQLGVLEVAAADARAQQVDASSMNSRL